jgi:hypothetical protein
MLCVNSNTGIHFYYFTGEKFDNKPIYTYSLSNFVPALDAVPKNIFKGGIKTSVIINDTTELELEEESISKINNSIKIDYKKKSISGRDIRQKIFNLSPNIKINQIGETKLYYKQN